MPAVTGTGLRRSLWPCTGHFPRDPARSAPGMARAQPPSPGSRPRAGPGSHPRSASAQGCPSRASSAPPGSCSPFPSTAASARLSRPVIAPSLLPAAGHGADGSPGKSGGICLFRALLLPVQSRENPIRAIQLEPGPKSGNGIMQILTSTAR